MSAVARIYLGDSVREISVKSNDFYVNEVDANLGLTSVTVNVDGKHYRNVIVPIDDLKPDNEVIHIFED